MNETEHSVNGAEMVSTVISTTEMSHNGSFVKNATASTQQSYTPPKPKNNTQNLVTNQTNRNQGPGLYKARRWKSLPTSLFVWWHYMASCSLYGINNNTWEQPKPITDQRINPNHDNMWRRQTFSGHLLSSSHHFFSANPNWCVYKVYEQVIHVCVSSFPLMTVHGDAFQQGLPHREIWLSHSVQ